MRHNTLDISKRSRDLSVVINPQPFFEDSVVTVFVLWSRHAATCFFVLFVLFFPFLLHKAVAQQRPTSVVVSHALPVLYV